MKTPSIPDLIIAGLQASAGWQVVPDSDSDIDTRKMIVE